MIKARLDKIAKPLEEKVQPVLVRNPPSQPLHHLARLRQSKGRWYTTHATINAAVRRFMSTAGENASKYSRSSYPPSRTAAAISRATCRAPFSSTLRPNLTGGAIPRSAGGYSLGGSGGARYFSHGPAAPAQVMHNVSTACRAFWLSGQHARFDGVTPQGEKKFRSVSKLEKEAMTTMQSMRKHAPGSYIEFQLGPVVTALSCLATSTGKNATLGQSTTTLNREGFLDVLSVDFARALQDLAAVMADLKRLSELGDLPISLETSTTLRVHFPGCDAETVERLCDEVGIRRGIIHQDARYMESVGGDVALRFPCAPDSEPCISSPGASLRSQTGYEMDADDLDNFNDAEDFENPWLEGYASMQNSREASLVRPSQLNSQMSSHGCSSSEFEGLEGIYRFIEQCDQAGRRY